MLGGTTEASHHGVTVEPCAVPFDRLAEGAQTLHLKCAAP